MQTIPLAFFIVMLELSIGSYLVLYALDIRNDTSINFVRFQAVLYLVLFTLLAWATEVGFASAPLLKSIGYTLDYRWLDIQGPTLGWFLILQAAYAVLLVRRSWRVARLIAGGGAAVLGTLCLFSVGMGYRSIEAAHLAGALTVLGFITGALALGGVSTAMLLGHWYLNTPTASGKPLEFATALTIAGIALQIVFGLFAGNVTYAHPASTTHVATSAIVAKYNLSTAHALDATQSARAHIVAVVPTPVAGAKPPASSVPHGVQFNTLTLVLLEYIVGLGIPLALSIIAFNLERDRSFQSATGMLYIAVVFAFFGEVLARNLFLQPLI